MVVDCHTVEQHYPKGCIWLIGGTSESALLANALSVAGLPFVVTVTTASARELYTADTRVFVGLLSASEMTAFVQKWRVRCILDASHPFADMVSRGAIALVKTWAEGNSQGPSQDAIQGPSQDAMQDAIQDHGLAYLRYERPSVAALAQPSAQLLEDNVIYVDSLDDLAVSDVLQHQRVLFTLGYRSLARFASLRQTAVLFARVLPSTEAISGAIAAGFSSKELVALRPPVSPAVESALWQQWKITCVVAKASGLAGGEAIKRAIASDLGVTLVLINRPQLIYPNQTNSVMSSVEFCAKTLSLY